MKAILIALSPSIGMQFYTAGVANILSNHRDCTVTVIGSAALRKNAFEQDVALLPGHVFSGAGLSAGALNPFGFRRLLAEIARIKPSVIHFTGPHVWNWPLSFCLRKQYPLILTQHDAATHEGAKGEWIKRFYRRQIIRSVDCVIVHSTAVEQALKDGGLAAAEMITMPMVHHNFDYALYQQIRARECVDSCHEDMALLFGRLEEYKGVRQFVDAARILSTLDGTSVRMVVAGTGRLAEALDGHELPNLEVRNRLIDDRETTDLFSRAGLVVLPYTEGSQSALIPLAYLFCKPVLVTRVGALPEYVRDGVSGRIIDSNDPYILAQTIREMLSDKEKSKQMGRQGRDLLQELEAEFVAKLLRTYEAVASRS